MCGAIENVNTFPGLPGILSEAGYTPEEIAEITGIKMSQKRELRPTDLVPALVPTRSGRQAFAATWWLKLDSETLKPDTRWATFNCQSRRLLSSKLHSIPPRSYRSVVLAKGFLDIHHKSFPLILNLDELDAWLDPSIPLDEFKHLFEVNTYRQRLEVVAVNEPDFEPVSDPALLAPGQ